MKLILSRKGFDSKYGGGPSPILDGRRIFSVPIVYWGRETVRRFSDLRFEGQNLGELIEQLYSGRVHRDAFCHLDPDLRRDLLPNRTQEKNWRPLFGQADQAASHLVRTHGVGEGDLFLFFGLFRASHGWERFARNSNPIHLIHGWLQVQEVVYDPVDWARQNPWAAAHPHTYGGWWKSNNVLFVAKDYLEICRGQKRLKTQIPGAGVFCEYHDQLRLTDPGSTNSAIRWKLPAALCPDPSRGKTILTLGKGTWTVCDDGKSVNLDPGYIRLWQEAVIDGNPEAVEWAIELIQSAQR